MWASLPAVAREFIYENNLPLKIAHIDESFELPETEIRVAGIARNDAEEMLFVRSRRDGRDWEFPGGRLEDDETPTEAIHREFEEETGHQVTSAEPLLALVWAFRESTIIQLVYHIHAGEDSGQLDESEVCDIGWFDDLPENISFGEAGEETYRVIINSSQVTVAFEDEQTPSTIPRKKSLAMGGAVAGGAIAAGLARRLLSKRRT